VQGPEPPAPHVVHQSWHRPSACGGRRTTLIGQGLPFPQLHAKGPSLVWPVIGSPALSVRRHFLARAAAHARDRAAPLQFLRHGKADLNGTTLHGVLPQFARSPCQRDRRHKAAGGQQPTRKGSLPAIRVGREAVERVHRHPEVARGADIDTGELGWRNPDDRERELVDQDRLPDDRWI